MIKIDRFWFKGLNIGLKYHFLRMEDVNAHYSVGEPMTFEQMSATRRGEKEVSLYNPFENTEEENPYLFEDKPIGMRRFAVVSIVGESFPQKHEGKKCMMKIKVSTVSHEKATAMCKLIQEKDNKYALYILEMFKFVSLPPLDGGDMDSEMNTAISMEYTALEDEKKEFTGRKQRMLDEVKRHNEIAKKIANGDLDASNAESAPIFPERMLNDSEDSGIISESMEPDPPLCTDRYVVLATLKITKYVKMQDHVILKLCGTFENEADANSHMKSLKKDTKYKLFDVTVCNMYVWLEIPPPYELIETVMYDSEKLTETLGVRKQTINVDSSDLQCPQDE